MALPTGSGQALWSSLQAMWAGLNNNLYKINPDYTVENFGSITSGIPTLLHFTQCAPLTGTFSPNYGTPGIYTFTVPADVTSVTISATGAGGGGGGSSAGNSIPNPNPSTQRIRAGGGGGGGDGTTQTFTVTPGEIWTINIPTGGSGGIGQYPTATNGSAGSGNTTIVSNLQGAIITLVPGQGGIGGSAVSASVGGQGGAGGGNGGTGGISGVAATNKNGQVLDRAPASGSGTYGGTASSWSGSTYVAGGGGGGSSIGYGGASIENAAGSNGTQGGGGGGAGGWAIAGMFNGGNGGDGIVQLSYSPDGSTDSPEGPIFFHNENIAWTIASGATSVTPIADGDFPDGPLCPGAVYLDGFVFVMTQLGRIYNSAIEDPTSWGALDFITAASDPDHGVALSKQLNYIVAFSTYSTQFFYDAGQPTGSPLLLNQTANTNIGCASGHSVSAFDNTIAWIGQSRTHGRGVYVLEGLSSKKISTENIEKILDRDPLQNVRAFTWKLGGHTMYVLTLKDSNITLVYDMEQQVWYTWTSYDETTLKENFFSKVFFSRFNNIPYLLDDSSGFIAQGSFNLYDDAGIAIQMQGYTPIEDSGTTKRKHYRRAEIIGDKIDGTLVLSHSGNDYNVQSNGRNINLNAPRSQLVALGADRRRSWKWLVTDNVPVQLDALELTFDIGGINAGPPEAQ